MEYVTRSGADHKGIPLTYECGQIWGAGHRHPHLTTQKSFYVEISRARDRAELVTDDAAELRAQLQVVTGERIAALEGIGQIHREAQDRSAEAAHGDPGKEAGARDLAQKNRESSVSGRKRVTGVELGV